MMLLIPFEELRWIPEHIFYELYVVKIWERMV